MLNFDSSLSSKKDKKIALVIDNGQKFFVMWVDMYLVCCYVRHRKSFHESRSTMLCFTSSRYVCYPTNIPFVHIFTIAIKEISCWSALLCG
jgi:hypothetical protein